MFPGMYLNRAKSVGGDISLPEGEPESQAYNRQCGDQQQGLGIGNNTRSDFGKLILALTRTRREFHFVGVSIPPEIPDLEKRTLNELNRHAKTKLGNSFIKPLPASEVSVCPNDVFKIHYDRITLSKICHNIVSHFLCFPRGRGAQAIKPIENRPEFSTVNLSSYTPTPTDLGLLEKGLTFIPTRKTLPISNIIHNKNKLIRSIKLRYFFQNKTTELNGNDFKKRFKESKNWSPLTTL